MKLIYSLFLLLSITTHAQKHKVAFKTNYGTFKVVLYDHTPKHRDHFLQSIADTTYHNALFNRIIKNFVVQGGEHDIDIANRETANPNQNKPRLNYEYSKKAFHKLGALGAGRDDNPEKASFLNQIYFVVGKPVTKNDLDAIEIKKGIKFTKKQRKMYLKYGGLPRLDYDYTVFGEVYEGLDKLLKISAVTTDSLDYPLTPIHFNIKLIN